MNTTKTIPNLYHIEEGLSWIGGPTHSLQRQHIPGYGGHVPTLISENVHGKGFTRVSAECLNARTNMGFKLDADEMYKTNYNQQFEKPDIRKTNFTLTAERLLSNLEQREVGINQSNIEQYSKEPKSIEQIKPIDRVSVIGYMGHKPVFRHPFRSVRPPSEPKPVHLREINEVKTMLDTNNFDIKRLSSLSKKEVPVVGYAGYLKNVKAQNMFGQTYNDLAHKSIHS